MKKLPSFPCAYVFHEWVAMCRWRKNDQVSFQRCKKCGARRYKNEIFWRRKKIR